MSSNWRKISSFLGFGLGASSLFSAAVSDTNYYYIGSDARFDVAKNWQAGLVPPPDASSTRLVFALPSAAALQLPASGFAAYGLSFSSTGVSFLLTGPQAETYATLSLGSGGISVGSSSTQVELANLNLALASDQTWNTGTGTLSVTGNLSGSGALVKNGTGLLVLSGSNSGYSGAVSLGSGTTRLTTSGALGSGAVTLSGNARLEAGTDSPTRGFELENDFVVGNGVTFATASGHGGFSLAGLFQTQFRDSVVRLGEKATLFLQGAVSSQAGAGSSLTFSTDNASAPRGAAILYSSASLDSSLTSIKADGATVAFASNALLNSAPAISAVNKGVVSVMGESFLSATSERWPGQIDHNALLGWTLANITDKASFDGTLSLDTVPGSPYVSYSGFGELNTLDLSGFSSSKFTLGSTTQASIDSGTVILPPGSDGIYRFGDGGGRLFINSDLSGNGLSVVSPSHSPLTLVLDGTNGYSGLLSDYSVYVEHSFLVLNNEYALPSNTDQEVRKDAKVNLGDGGYLSVTDQIGLDTTNLFSRLGTYTDKSIVGFDSFYTYEGPAALSGNLDLSAFVSAPYIGTMTGWAGNGSSGFRIPAEAKIIAPQDGIVKFVAVGGRDTEGAEQGALLVDAPLTKTNGVFSVVYGHPDASITFGSWDTPGRYVIGGSYTDDNITTVSDYEGGTAIYGGQFELNGPYPFGKKASGAPGSISVLSGAGTVSFKPLQNVELGSIGAYNKALLFGNADDSSAVLGLAGLSGSAQAQIAGPVVLHSANSSFSGGFLLDTGNASLLAENNASLGTGAVSLGSGLLQFGNDAGNPVIWNLSANGGTLLLSNDASSLTLNLTRDSTFFGQIAGALGDGTSTEAKLIVNNSDGAAFTLGSGNQLYSGGTEINGGALLVQASSSSSSPLGAKNSTVTLNNANLALRPIDAEDGFGPVVSNPLVFGTGSNTLSGTGTFASPTPVTIGEYTRVSPGAYSTLGTSVAFDAYVPPAAGTLTFYSSKDPGTLTFAGGGSYDLVIVDPTLAAGVGYSTVFVNGTLDVTADASSKFLFNIITANGNGGLAPLPSTVIPGTTFSLTVVHTTGGITFNGQEPFAPSALGFDFTYFTPALGTNAYSWSFALGNEGHDLVLNFTPVPEPETWAMLAAGSLLVLFPKLRRLFRRSSGKA